jgi:DNA-binding transcriptional MerR regulator
MQIITCIRAHFASQPSRFEAFAAHLWQMADGRVGSYEVTRASVDGGRDAVGEYRIGPTADPVAVTFALEAKLYDPAGGAEIATVPSVVLDIDGPPRQVLIGLVGQRLRRQYLPQVLDTLAVAALCQGAGFSLAEIKALLATGGGPGWKALATRKRDELRGKARQLDLLADQIDHALGCRSANASDCEHFQAALRQALPGKGPSDPRAPNTARLSLRTGTASVEYDTRPQAHIERVRCQRHSCRRTRRMYVNNGR